MTFLEINANFGTQTHHLLLYILVLFIIWIVLIISSNKTYGFLKTIRFFVPMMIVGLFIESGGVATGEYYYPGYFIYLNVLGGAVPVIIVLGWSSNLFLLLHLGKQMISKFYQKQNIIQLILIALCTGIFGVLLDLLQDPLAHHNHWWIWTDSSASTISFFEVPLWNFRGWFILLFMMSLTTLLIDKSGFSEKRKLLISLSSTAIIGGIILAIRVFITLIGLS